MKEDYSTLTLEELKEKLEELEEEYANLHIQKATHELTNPIRIRFVRRDIARVKTFIRQHELGIIKTKEKEQA